MKQLRYALTSFALAACGAETHTTIPASPTPSAPAVSASASTAAPNPDVPAATEHKAGEPLVFTPASDWVVEQPSSKMRVAQYKLPKVAGDSDDAELVVFHFGAVGGGSVDANLERWCSQFAQPDGRDSSEVLTRSERKVAGLDVIEVRLSGTYVAETSPGSGQRLNQPGYAMLAAIFRTDQGDYYAKLVGPANTVEHHAAAFRTFTSNVK